MYGILQDIVQAQQTSQDRQEQQQGGQTEHLDEELVLFFFRELGVGGVGRHDQAAAGGRRAEAGKGSGQAHDGDKALRLDADLLSDGTDRRHHGGPHDADRRAEPREDAGGQALNGDCGLRRHDGSQTVRHQRHTAHVRDNVHQHTDAGDHHQGGPRHTLDDDLFVCHIEEQQDDCHSKGDKADVPLEKGAGHDHGQKAHQRDDLLLGERGKDLFFLALRLFDPEALEHKEDNKGQHDGGDGRVDQGVCLIAGDALLTGEVVDQDAFRRDGGEPACHGTDLTDRRQHNGVIASALAQRQAQCCGDAQRRHTAGADGCDDVADQVYDDRGDGHMAAGQAQKLFCGQLQRTVVGSDGTQQRDTQQHDEGAGAEPFDDLRVCVTGRRTKNGCGQNGDQTDVLFQREADCDAGNQHDQGKQCNTIAHKNCLLLFFLRMALQEKTSKLFAAIEHFCQTI